MTAARDAEKGPRTKNAESPQGNSALFGRPVSGLRSLRHRTLPLSASRHPRGRELQEPDAKRSHCAVTLGDDHHTEPPPFPSLPLPAFRARPRGRTLLGMHPTDPPAAVLPVAPVPGCRPVPRPSPEPSGSVWDSCCMTMEKIANRISEYQHFIHKIRIYVSIIYPLNSVDSGMHQRGVAEPT